MGPHLSKRNKPSFLFIQIVHYVVGITDSVHFKVFTYYHNLTLNSSFAVSQ